MYIWHMTSLQTSSTSCYRDSQLCSITLSCRLTDLQYLVSFCMVVCMCIYIYVYIIIQYTSKSRYLIYLTVTSSFESPAIWPLKRSPFGGRRHIFKQPRLFTHDESYETTEAHEEMLTQNSETSITVPKTNIAPENRGSQKESSIPTTNF